MPIDQKYGKVTLENRPDAPDDEPVFVLRAQDILAPIAVRAYARSLQEVPGDKYKSDAERVQKIADEMGSWRGRKMPD